MNYEDVLKKIVQIIIEGIEPEKIILFGSRAKNIHRKGSDIDLAIKGGKALSFRDLRKLKEKIDEISGLYSVDMVFLDKVEENFKNYILGYGKVLYEKE